MFRTLGRSLMKSGGQISQIQTQTTARIFTTARMLQDDNNESGKPPNYEKSMNSVTLLGK